MIYKNFICLLISTLATVHYVQASDETVCESQLTPGDKARGLSAISDFACMSADGCFKVNADTNCRYCKVDASVESEYQVCQTLLQEVEQGRRTCEQSVSIGDKKNGLVAFYDPTCDDPLADGLGCFDHCRLCQKHEKNKRSSTPYYRCDALPTPPPQEPTTTEAASQPTDEPTSTEAASQPTDEPTSTEAASQPTDEPTSTDAASQSTDEPTTTQEAGSQDADVDRSCNQKLSEEEAKSGIGAVQDMTCQSTDASCFDNTCRYCKVFDTPVSVQYGACQNNICSANVSQGDRSVGISAFVDNTCLEGSKIGCWDPNSICRYCKVFNTAISDRFVHCYAEPASSGSSSGSF